MNIQLSELENGIKVIRLEGRMDMKGVESIDLKFNSYASTEKSGIVVDLSQVDFLSSAGIRLLLTNARAVQMRGGKMALLKPTFMVAEILATSGVEQWIPSYDHLEAACSAVLAEIKP